MPFDIEEESTKNGTKMSKALYKRGYSTGQICAAFGVTHAYLYKMIKRPAKYFTVDRIIILAGLCQIPLVDAFWLVMGGKPVDLKNWSDED